jgi:hypothetical protein
MKKFGFALTAAGVLLALATAAVAGEEYAGAIEEWEATTVQMDVGKMTIVRIGIMEWSTAAEREDILNALQSGGSAEVVKYLDQQSEKGYVKFPNAAAYQMRYAYQAEHDGKRYIVMGTDRPVGNIMRREANDTLQNNISLLSLELDPTTGKGVGQMVAGADIVFDEKTNQLKIEHVGTQPIRFTSVKAIKQKKKKDKD